MIKKYYFINKFDTNSINKQDKQTSVIYRNYDSKIDESIIYNINNYCKKNSIKFFLSNNIELAIKLNLNGVYIPAFNNSFKHLAYSLKKNFKIIGSAHNIREIEVKKIQKCDEIFISSLFYNPKNKNFLGIVKFNLLAMKTNLKVIALGGIQEKNLKKLTLTKSDGFAGIRYFEQKKSPS